MASTIKDTTFKKLDKQSWRALVEKELKGKQFEDFLVSKNFAAPSIEAYQNIEDLKALSIDPAIVQSAVQYFACADTKKGFRIFVDDEKKANKKALLVLAQGINSIHFKAHKASIDWEPLLKDIDSSLIRISFCCHPNDLLKNIYDLNPAPNSQIAAEVSPFSPSFNLPVLASDFAEVLKMASKGNYQASLCINFDDLAAAGADFALQLACIKKFYSDWIRELRNHDILHEGLAETQISHAFSTLFFGEIAKHRAMCCMLAEVLQEEKVNTRNFKPGGFRISYNEIFKGGIDPEVNLIRFSSFAFAAMACNPDDLQLVAYKEEDKNYVDRVSANIHNVLCEESKLNHYIDPGAGSYFLEVLTQEILEAALECYDAINIGPWHIFAHHKEFTAALQRAAEELRTLYNNKELLMVGENLYPPTGTTVTPQLETLTIK